MCIGVPRPGTLLVGSSSGRGCLKLRGVAHRLGDEERSRHIDIHNLLEQSGSTSLMHSAPWIPI